MIRRLRRLLCLRLVLRLVVLLAARLLGGMLCYLLKLLVLNKLSRYFSITLKQLVTGRVMFRLLLEPLDDIGRFLASLRFEQKGKLDQLGIEVGLFDL